MRTRSGPAEGEKAKLGAFSGGGQTCPGGGKTSVVARAPNFPARFSTQKFLEKF
jgi:hypothetical protein